MPRFALVAHWDWVLANFRLALAARLRELGHEVVLVCPHGEHLDTLRAAGFEPRHWDVDRRGMNPLREPGAIRDLRRVLAAVDPDAVQSFTIKPNLYAPLAVAPGVPVLGLFSGLGWAFGDDARARLTRAALTPVARRALRGRADVHLATQNDRDRRLLVQHGWARDEQVRVLPNGVEVARFARPAARPLAADGPLRLVTACRLLRDKGVVELVAAVGELRAGGRDVTATIAGEIDAGNPRSLTAAEVHDLGRHDGIEFVGHVDTDAIVTVLHRSDVAVLATSYNEGTPRFLLEAGAAGLALVASDIAGVRQALEHEVNGLLVDPASSDSLVRALARLHDDRALVAQMARRAVARAVAEHDEARVVDAYVAWYAEVGVVTGGAPGAGRGRLGSAG